MTGDPSVPGKVNPGKTLVTTTLPLVLLVLFDPGGPKATSGIMPEEEVELGVLV